MDTSARGIDTIVLLLLEDELLTHDQAVRVLDLADAEEPDPAPE